MLSIFNILVDLTACQTIPWEINYKLKVKRLEKARTCDKRNKRSTFQFVNPSSECREIQVGGGGRVDGQGQWTRQREWP